MPFQQHLYSPHGVNRNNNGSYHGLGHPGSIDRDRFVIVGAATTGGAAAGAAAATTTPLPKRPTSVFMFGIPTTSTNAAGMYVGPVTPTNVNNLCNGSICNNNDAVLMSLIRQHQQREQQQQQQQQNLVIVNNNYYVNEKYLITGSNIDNSNVIDNGATIPATMMTTKAAASSTNTAAAASAAAQYSSSSSSSSSSMPSKLNKMMAMMGTWSINVDTNNSNVNITTPKKDRMIINNKRPAAATTVATSDNAENMNNNNNNNNNNNYNDDDDSNASATMGYITLNKIGTIPVRRPLRKRRIRPSSVAANSSTMTMTMTTKPHKKMKFVHSHERQRHYHGSVDDSTTIAAVAAAAAADDDDDDATTTTTDASPTCLTVEVNDSFKSLWMLAMAAEGRTTVSSMSMSTSTSTLTSMITTTADTTTPMDTSLSSHCTTSTTASSTKGVTVIENIPTQCQHPYACDEEEKDDEDDDEDYMKDEVTMIVDAIMQDIWREEKEDEEEDRKARKYCSNDDGNVVIEDDSADSIVITRSRSRRYRSRSQVRTRRRSSEDRPIDVIQEHVDSNDASMKAKDATKSKSQQRQRNHNAVTISKKLTTTKREKYDETKETATTVPQTNNVSSTTQPCPTTKNVHSKDDGTLLTLLYREGHDEGVMTAYQCMLRQQLLVFEATDEDVNMSKSPGRCGMAVHGQVGLKCKWCSEAVSSSPTATLTKGSVYYSKTVVGLYQIAQNMGRLHLLDRCTHVPAVVRKDLAKLRNGDGCGSGRKSSKTIPSRAKALGGKRYWADTLKQMGLYESNGCVWVRHSSAGTPSSKGYSRRGRLLSTASRSSSLPRRVSDASSTGWASSYPTTMLSPIPV